MDKRVIFAVAGSGKTTKIVKSLSNEERVLIFTYSDANHDNLQSRILDKFCGVWPENIALMTYFKFLYNFCYKPFLADTIKAIGITFKKPLNRYVSHKNREFYLSHDRHFYSNRLGYFLQEQNLMADIKSRIEKYFDRLIIDEVQDIAGRDFDFLEDIMTANVNMLFVGDFYQHTYDTSTDGNKNKGLHDDYSKYQRRFTAKGFDVDTSSLSGSWRCGPNICEFITQNLGIEIHSRNSNNDSIIKFISDQSEIERIMADDSIIKLHYKNADKYGSGHKNWGKTKGEDRYDDVCVLLYGTAMTYYFEHHLDQLKNEPKNKLYVAITRAHGNCYLVDERRTPFENH